MTDSSVTNEVVEKVQEQTNFLVSFWRSIDWHAIAVTVSLRLLQLLLVIIMLGLIKKIGEYLIDTQFKKYLTRRVSMPNRFHTLYTLTKNLFHAILWFFFVYAILSLIGVPVGTLLAGAGVVGLAFSLGAQGFVSDIVNGFFILLEKQIDIGDVVRINDLSGTVADVNLKTTKLKDFDGTVHYIPNREITIISNQSREEMRVQIQIPLSPESDFEKIKFLLDQETIKLVPHFPQITQPPTPFSVVPFDNVGGLAAQVSFYTTNGEQYGVKNAFLEQYMDVLQKEQLLPVHYLRAAK